MIEYTTQEMQMIPYKDRRKIEKKVLPEYYKGIRTHKKMFELRKDEDGIKPGDILVLREWDGEKYTGGMTKREVTAVLKDCPEYGLMDGYCILSLQTPGWDFVKPSAQPETTRTFVELVVEYPDPEFCAHKEYKGKPYYSIKYTENGQEFIGYGTYKPEVLSEYLKEYFMSSAQTDLIAKIQNGIKATDLDDIYFCGMRNGMRWCISLIDGKEPLYENCPSAQPDFDTDQKINKAYDDGYNQGYLQYKTDQEGNKMEKANATLGTRISDLLEQQGLSQRELAGKVGVTEVSMSRYIKGERTPKGPTIANIAKVLHTTSDFLLGLETEETDISE